MTSLVRIKKQTNKRKRKNNFSVDQNPQTKYKRRQSNITWHDGFLLNEFILTFQAVVR